MEDPAAEREMRKLPATDADEAQGNGVPVTPKSTSPKNNHRHRTVRAGMTDDEIRAKELFITNAIVDYPYPIMGCCFIACIIMAIISFGVIGFAISEARLEDRGDHRTEKSDAVFQAQDIIDDQPTGIATIPGAPKNLLRSATLTSWGIIYMSNGDDVFTEENVKFMRETEQKIEMHPEFKYHCRLIWFPKGSDCPGKDCPWYIPQWDFTYDSSAKRDILMPDGSRAVCASNTRSLSWVMYNMRLGIFDPTTNQTEECDVDRNMEFCVKNGTLTPLLFLKERSPEEWQVLLRDEGGLPPTQQQIRAFLRKFHYMMETESKTSSWLTPFFSKDWGNDALPNSDPQKWKSKVTRASIVFGGPRERVNPADIKLPCQTISDPTTCNGTNGCVYNQFGGVNKSTLGCNYVQYHEVSSIFDAEINVDQWDDWADWGDNFIDYFNERDDGPSEVLWFSLALVFDIFLEIIIRDSLLGIASFIFVYLYIQIHTGSFFLATLGMIQVIMPFPMAYFVYRVIFQVGAFYGLSALALYIVLAIGADDIFVFMDNWVQADVSPRPDNAMYMKGRMAIAWKTAGSAMGITSLTTMVAFIATMTSPLLEIGLFGLVAATLVFWDYLLVMTFFAAAVVVYHRHFENTIGCCCCGQQACGAWCNCCTCFGEELEPDNTKQVECLKTMRSAPRTCETIEEAREKYGPQLDHGEVVKTQPHQAEGVGEKITDDAEYKKRRIAGFVLMALAVIVYVIAYVILAMDRSSGYKFLYVVFILCVGLVLFCASMNAFRAARSRKEQLGHVVDLSFMTQTAAPFLAGTQGSVTRRMLRFVPGAVLVIFWAIMVAYATELGPTTKTEQWLPDWHPLQRYFDSSTDDFPSNDQDYVQKVAVSFGFNPDGPIDRDGTDKYDMDDRGKPVFLKNDHFGSPESQRFMLELCNQIFSQSHGPNAKLLQRTLMEERDQNCLMRGFRDFVENKATNTSSFPVPEAQFLPYLWELYTHQQKTRENNNIFLMPYEVYYDKVLFDFGNGETNPPTGVKLIIFEFNTTLLQWGNAHGAIEDWYETWDDWIQEVNEAKPQWVKDIYGQTPFNWNGKILHSSDVWVWMHTQWLLVQGAIFGTILSLALAAAIIFLATLNILVALCVLIELIGVVGCVLGIVAVMGWELGMIESVSITVLVGLSVDYVVHYAVHYCHVNIPEDEETRGWCTAFKLLGKNDELSAYIKEPTERQRRVHETVCHMGATVLGGAATSIGAALILFTTWVQFYFKFGAFFFLTILFSYLWANFFFLPLMSIVGPEREFLSLRPLLARCFPKACGKNEEVEAASPSQQQDAAERTSDPERTGGISPDGMAPH